MYRYFKLIENSIVLPNQYRIKLPEPARYHKECEWRYTFTQIFNNIKKDLRYQFSLLLFNICKKMDIIEFCHSTEYKTKEIDNVNLNKHISEVIKQLRYSNMLYN